MIFYPDLTKQAQEVICSRKTKKLLNLCLSFNGIPLKNKKYLELTLFEGIKNITQKISEIKGLLRRFQLILPRSCLLTIYKKFIRGQLDFADIIYDQAYNPSFHEKLESLQHNACLAITGAIRGTSSEKLYQELELESLKLRHWFRKCCHFYKIFFIRSLHHIYSI